MALAGRAWRWRDGIRVLEILMERRIPLLLLALLFMVWGATCQTGPGTPTSCDGVALTGNEPPAGVSVGVEEVVANAADPVALAFAPDGRLFYTEKETVGIALHPDFPSNRYVYVFYTRSTTGGDTQVGTLVQDNRVVRFTASGDVAAGDETVIFTLPATPGPNHNGGNLHFGPDGKLYVTQGELAVRATSQDLNAIPGRILRLNDDGSIPGDNPFGSSNPTYALGLRNSFDFTFDPVSDEIFATENGTNAHDEVNRLPAGSNGGWPEVEGCSEGAVSVSAGTYVQPIVSTDGIVVPTGIVFVPGQRYGAASENTLLVAEYQTGRIVRYTLNTARTQMTSASVLTDNIAGGLTDLAFSPDGTLYATTKSPGRILRIAPTP
jgi:glucose/arabinose dehydrogenase